MNQGEDSSDNKIACVVCGRAFEPQGIEYDDQTGRSLCAECLAEDQGCGCADD